MTNRVQIAPLAQTHWRLAFLLSAIAAIGPLSIDMYLPSLPTLVRDLGATAQEGQASVSVFFAGLALGQFVYGPASDRFGRRGLLFFGLGLFVVASIVSAVAPSIDALIAARLAQSLGSCACMVISRAVVRDHFDHQESARFFTILALVAGAAPVLAPLLGSLVLSFAGWRAIFGFLAVFGACVGIAMYFNLPESRSASTAERARQEHPLRAYLALLSERRLIGYLLAGSLNSACMFTYIAISPAILIGIFGLTPTQFGLLFGVNAVGMVTAAQINRHLLSRHSADGILGAVAASGVLLAPIFTIVAFSGLGKLWGVAASLFLVTSCAGFFQSNAMAGALSVDPLRAGSTSALLGGGAFGVGAIASSLAGALHDGTPRPMLLVISVCLVLSAAATWFLALPGRHQSAD